MINPFKKNKTRKNLFVYLGLSRGSRVNSSIDEMSGQRRGGFFFFFAFFRSGQTWQWPAAGPAVLPAGLFLRRVGGSDAVETPESLTRVGSALPVHLVNYSIPFSHVEDAAVNISAHPPSRRVY